LKKLTGCLKSPQKEFEALRVEPGTNFLLHVSQSQPMPTPFLIIRPFRCASRRHLLTRSQQVKDTQGFAAGKISSLMLTIWLSQLASIILDKEAIDLVTGVVEGIFLLSVLLCQQNWSSRSTHPPSLPKVVILIGHVTVLSIRGTLQFREMVQAANYMTSSLISVDSSFQVLSHSVTNME